MATRHEQQAHTSGTPSTALATTTRRSTNASGTATFTQKFASAGIRTYYATFAGDTKGEVLCVRASSLSLFSSSC
jgi:hypothetical protein